MTFVGSLHNLQQEWFIMSKYLGLLLHLFHLFCLGYFLFILDCSGQRNWRKQDFKKVLLGAKQGRQFL